MSANHLTTHDGLPFQLLAGIGECLVALHDLRPGDLAIVGSIAEMLLQGTSVRQRSLELIDGL